MDTNSTKDVKSISGLLYCYLMLCKSHSLPSIFLIYLFIRYQVFIEGVRYFSRYRGEIKIIGGKKSPLELRV